MANKKPNPGSDEAIEQGCICPVLDNARGKGIEGYAKEPVFWLREGCPLHAPPKSAERKA